MSLEDGSVGEERGHLLGEAWSHHRDDSAAAGGGGDGADTARRALGAGVSRLTPCSAPGDVQKWLVSELWQ